MFLREPLDTTLEELEDQWTRQGQTWNGSLANVYVELEEETPRIQLGSHDIPATPEGIQQIGRFVGIPSPFLKKIQKDEQQFLLTRRIERADDQEVSVTYTSEGLVDILKAGQLRIDPSQLVGVARGVMPEGSTIVEAHYDSDDLLLDVAGPFDSLRFTGGDRAVDDITAGGIRITQNRKQNLAPGVQPLLYRLACTNGYEICDPGMKVDARGAERDEVLRMLQFEAQRALDRTQSDIEAFYDLRNQRLDADRTGHLRRVAKDTGMLSIRAIGLLEDTLPEYIGDEVPTMFDVVNLMTNLANDPNLSGPNRRKLQQAGGSVISDHASRCSTCHAKLLS